MIKIRIDKEKLGKFKDEIDTLKEELMSSKGDEDVKHVIKLELIINIFTIFGLATLWLELNIFTVLALAAANLGRYSILGHTLMHGAYDSIPGVPDRLKSDKFGQGYRRYIDYWDWVKPIGWKYEHNGLHHHYLGEKRDPDEVQRASVPVRNFKAPIILKRLYMVMLSLSWKSVFLAPNITNALVSKEQGVELGKYPTYWDRTFWTRSRIKRVALDSWIPYITTKFIIVPSLFLIISVDAWQNALISIVIAEMIANSWSYWTTVPNHASKNIYIFKNKTSSKEEFYLHQVLGTVNYNCGGNFRDFMHGWSNYHIEHHLFPQITLRQYQQVQPKVKELCLRYGIPYIQKSIFKSMKEMSDIVVGKENQKIWIDSSAIKN